MRPTPPGWVDPLMRIGYSARGAVFALVGFLAMAAALYGGSAPDSKDALATLLQQTWGSVMLGAIALGLIAYAAWCFTNAALDLDDKGSDPKGWLKRTPQFVGGVVYLSLAVTAIGLLRHRAEKGDRTDSWTADLMAAPLGRWAVAAVGAAIIAYGIVHCVQAYKGSYRKHLRYTPTAARLDPMVKFGLAAHGIVIMIIGSFFIWAAWTADPSRAGGLGEALNAVRDVGPGRALLATTALGLLAFSVYCFVQAKFRIVPRCASPDLATLASKARELGRDTQAAMVEAADRIKGSWSEFPRT
jgi:hypothetical protein